LKAFTGEENKLCHNIGASFGDVIKPELQGSRNKTGLNQLK
jgi:hypothetical protein